MRKIHRVVFQSLLLLVFVFRSSVATAQYTGQRVPLGILVTNWDCAPCAPVNRTLDGYGPTMGNDPALIRVHCWWSDPDDPISPTSTVCR